MLDPITNKSYYFVLTDISAFLGCKLLIRKQLSTRNVYYTITASSRSSLLITINYLESFTLCSSKHLDYKDWSKAVKLILSGNHYSSKGIVEIDNIRENMNKKRTFFS